LSQRGDVEIVRGKDSESGGGFPDLERPKQVTEVFHRRICIGIV